MITLRNQNLLFSNDFYLVKYLLVLNLDELFHFLINVLHLMILVLLFILLISIEIFLFESCMFVNHLLDNIMLLYSIDLLFYIHRNILKYLNGSFFVIFLFMHPTSANLMHWIFLCLISLLLLQNYLSMIFLCILYYCIPNQFIFLSRSYNDRLYLNLNQNYLIKDTTSL